MTDKHTIASLRPTAKPDEWELCIQTWGGTPIVHVVGLSSLLRLLEQITRIVISRFAGMRSTESASLNPTAQDPSPT